ncbi:bifunctional ADP-dependent NAD(P)H-hydrate dehydratase/NAD(P)H-hydrate epimerase [Specibacter sp. RAF43]|uniref:bifunctional ADP-dependent NAD(P)H-hydrate dehydratase/NAD(P)H-hydrate epimerase n=1 Tax=Specibacter sp. RAF43 TaxID=3233057 RepID=UPI003F9C3CC8
MLRAYTADAIRTAEQPLLDAGRGPELMRRAAHGLALGVRSVLRARGRRVYGARVVLLIGSGNNGGDALYAGATLAAAGARTTALLTSARTHPGALAAFTKAGGRLEWAPGAPGQAPGPAPAPAAAASPSWPFLSEIRRADVLVDGLLGTGGRGGLRGPAAGVVAQLSHLVAGGNGPAVVACDLPSGVDATTGEVTGPVLAAELTVTFGAAKTGLLAAPGEQLCGVVTVVDIGIGELLGEPDVFRLDGADLAALLPRVAAGDQKYTRGVAGIVAGSAQYPGAALLAVAAASACGPGMVRYLGPAPVAAALAVRNPEAVSSTDSPEDVRVQAWLAGPGIDGDAAQRERAAQALDSGLPTVLDAGALDLLAPPQGREQQGREQPLPRPHVILTPHAGELSALFARFGVERSRAAIEAAPLAAARQAAGLTGATVLLKGPTTVVAAPNGTVFTQSDGAASLATAGSGDTLGGMLAALLAMTAERDGWGLPGLAADARWAQVAALAAALHGRLATAGPGAPLNAGMLAARIPPTWAGLPD